MPEPDLKPPSDSTPPEPDSSKNSSGEPRDGKGNPKAKSPRPPVQTLVFWVLVLALLPALLVWYGQTRTEEEIDQLDASDFEEYLVKDRIGKAVIHCDASTKNVEYITGTYRPIQSQNGDGDGDAQTEVPIRKYRVEPIYSETLDQMLRDHAPQREVEYISDFWGQILLSLLPILLLVLLLYFLFSRQMKMAGKGAFQFGKSRARLMQPSREEVTFKDVAGADEAKDEVQEIIDFLKDPKKFQRLGGRIPKGVLMIGPPGTGKTLVARAIAGEAEVPFYTISGSDFVEMFVGVGASRVRDMFEEGKRNAPCILFIDEIDAVGRSRFSGIGGGHDEREQTLNALLVEMDGFEPNSGVIVIAATNRPDVLDPALLRPGRFDRQISIDMPDFKGRLGILDVHSKKVRLAEDADLLVIAKGTPGYSGADLANLMNEAALLAACQNKDCIEMQDLEEARDKVRWGRERRSRAIDERDRRITAFHEAGHALVGLLCEHAEPLHKVTIVPRGNAYLGATMHLPENDRYTKSCSEVMDELVVLMGGRMAEQLIFNDITSGAAMDISQATSLARRMVCEWGMSKRMGPLNYGSRSDHIYLGREITRSEDHSEQTTREIDEEVRAIIDSAASRTRKLLEDNREKLQLLGDTLLERETLGADEIRQLLGIPKPAPKTEEQRPQAERAAQHEEGAALPQAEESDAASQPADEAPGQDAEEPSGADVRDDA